MHIPSYLLGLGFGSITTVLVLLIAGRFLIRRESSEDKAACEHRDEQFERSLRTGEGTLAAMQFRNKLLMRQNEILASLSKEQKQ